MGLFTWLKQRKHNDAFSQEVEKQMQKLRGIAGADGTLANAAYLQECIQTFHDLQIMRQQNHWLAEDSSQKAEQQLLHTYLKKHQEYLADHIKYWKTLHGALQQFKERHEKFDTSSDEKSNQIIKAIDSWAQLFDARAYFLQSYLDATYRATTFRDLQKTLSELSRRIYVRSSVLTEFDISMKLPKEEQRTIARCVEEYPRIAYKEISPELFAAISKELDNKKMRFSREETKARYIHEATQKFLAYIQKIEQNILELHKSIPCDVALRNLQAIKDYAQKRITDDLGPKIDDAIDKEGAYCLTTYAEEGDQEGIRYAVELLGASTVPFGANIQLTHAIADTKQYGNGSWYSDAGNDARDEPRVSPREFAARIKDVVNVGLRPSKRTSHPYPWKQNGHYITPAVFFHEWNDLGRIDSLYGPVNVIVRPGTRYAVIIGKDPLRAVLEYLLITPSRVPVESDIYLMQRYFSRPVYFVENDEGKILRMANTAYHDAICNALKEAGITFREI